MENEAGFPSRLQGCPGPARPPPPTSQSVWGCHSHSTGHLGVTLNTSAQELSAWVARGQAAWGVWACSWGGCGGTALPPCWAPAPEGRHRQARKCRVFREVIQQRGPSLQMFKMTFTTCHYCHLITVSLVINKDHSSPQSCTIHF